MDNKLDLIRCWLSLFGSPVVVTLSDDKTRNSSQLGARVAKLENIMEVNDKVRDGVFFTPNGNYGEVNQHVGDFIKRKDSDAQKYISCLFIDLDKKDSSYANKSEKEYDDYVKKAVLGSQLKVQYMVKSGGGRHLYVFIDHQQRRNVGETLGNAGFQKISKGLCKMFDGGDASSMSFAKLIRMPFSLHHKDITPKEVKLYKIIVDNGEKKMVEVTKCEQITLDEYELVGLSGLQAFLANQEEQKLPINKKGITTNRVAQVNALNIELVLKRLENYPKEYEGRQYIFKLSGDKINIQIDGVMTYTDGYKINKADNYVNNFSMDVHGIEERPRGGVFHFLYFYFGRNVNKMSAFLNDEFGIEFYEEGTTTFLKVPTDNGIIFFQDDGVFYRTTKVKGKSAEEINEKLFDSPFIIKGIVRTNYGKKGESKSKNMYLVISLLDREEDEPENMIIDVLSTPQKFNDAYQKKGLTFMKSDGLLKEFYSGMKKGRQQGIIPRYEFLYLNGYYKDYYLEGNKMYDHNANLIEMNDKQIVFNNPEVLQYNIDTQITMSEFGEKLRTVFSDNESMLSFMAFLTLCLGHKFRREIIGTGGEQVIIPGLILSGHTKTGKTTLVNLLLNGFGISTEAKKKSVRGTTLQPLKQMATDDYIMHREEFTGDIGQEKENLIRDVLNKTNTARGQIDGDNEEYIYRSALILDGERMPESESVVNRCVTIAMNVDGRIGTQKLLRTFQGIGFKDDFIKSMFNVDMYKAKEDFINAQDTCLDNGITDRYSQMYAYILCVNRWFNIYFEDELIERIKENISSINDIEKESTPLARLLNDLCLTYHVKGYFDVNNDNYDITLTIPNSYIRSHITDILDVTKRYHGGKVKYCKGALLIHVPSKTIEDSEERTDLYKTFKIFRSHMIQNKRTDLNGLDEDL